MAELVHQSIQKKEKSVIYNMNPFQDLGISEK